MNGCAENDVNFIPPNYSNMPSYIKKEKVKADATNIKNHEQEKKEKAKADATNIKNPEQKKKEKAKADATNIKTPEQEKKEKVKADATNIKTPEQEKKEKEKNEFRANLIQDCKKIDVIYDSLKINDSTIKEAYVTSEDINKRFKKIKQFSSGKGGASVYWVNDLKNKGIDRVLKIFPEENFTKIFKKNNELREIYFSCKLAKEKFTDSKLSFSSDDNNFFPGFFGFGYTNTDKPFASKNDISMESNKKYFFMLMEFVKGKDMFVYSKDKKDEKSPYKDPQITTLILYQIISAIKNAHESLGFYHMDMHPGNIMLSSDKTITYTINKNQTITAPMVKIIDFGLSTGVDFYENDNINKSNALALKLRPKRAYSKVLLDFFINIDSWSSSFKGSSIAKTPLFITKAETLRKQINAGDDMQFFNMMLYSFGKIFKPFIDYCNNYSDCLIDINKFLEVKATKK